MILKILELLLGFWSLERLKRNSVSIWCHLQRLVENKSSLLWQLIALFITPLLECFSVTYNGFLGLSNVSMVRMMEFFDYHRHGHQSPVPQMQSCLIMLIVKHETRNGLNLMDVLVSISIETKFHYHYLRLRKFTDK